LKWPRSDYSLTDFALAGSICGFNIVAILEMSLGTGKTLKVREACMIQVCQPQDMRAATFSVQYEKG
jgi:hypothetical protein